MKRGVSPLLATVILIAAAISIGALVGNYMLSKAKEFNPEAISEESIYCDSVTLGYTALAEDSEAQERLSLAESDRGSIGPIILINRGSFSIHQLIITSPGYESLPPRNILRAGSLERGEIKPGISPESKYPITLQINTELVNKNIKIIPVILDREKNEFVRCTKRQLVINYEELCKDVYGDPSCNAPP